MHPETVFFSPSLTILCAKCMWVWRIYPFIRWSYFFFTKKSKILLEMPPKSSMCEEKQEVFFRAGQVGLPLPQAYMLKLIYCSCYLCGKLFWSILVFCLGTKCDQVGWFAGNDWNCTLLLESIVWVSCKALVNLELCTSQEFRIPNQALKFAWSLM